LGLEASDQNIPLSALKRDGFSVRYDAASDSYIFDLPSTNPAGMRVTSEDSAFWNGYLDAEDPSLSVLKPASTNPEIALAYTSLGIASGYYTSPFGFFAFGIPTPSSGVPVAGTASYEAYVRGRTLTDFAVVSGDATLQFDFGTGALSGQFDPVLNLNGVTTNLGTYDFVNTVFGAGSTAFSGGLSLTGAPSLGAFDGRFTGPEAQELMSRWTAPYLNPGTQQWSEMFGVWVGKRQ
jgi:hypothetical protein